MRLNRPSRWIEFLRSGSAKSEDSPIERPLPEPSALDPAVPRFLIDYLRVGVEFAVRCTEDEIEALASRRGHDRHGRAEMRCRREVRKRANDLLQSVKLPATQCGCFEE